ncbi:DUF6302 family protein [Streptomyces sp. NPDC000941]
MRLHWSPYRDASHVVEWGEVAPTCGEAVRNCFYGYSDTMRSPISSIAAKRRTEIPSSTWPFRSPAGCGPVEEGPYPPRQI